MITEAYRLAQGLIPAVDRMPRGLRSIAGTELVREVVGLCACLHEAALHAGKLEALRRADVHLTRTRVLARMAFDQKALALAAYEATMERAERAGKMIGGWIRSARGPHGAAAQDAPAPETGGGGEARS